VWEIDIPLMWRHIGTLGEVTQVAQVTMLYNFPVILLGDTIDFHGRRFIDKVEQGRERVTQADATSTTMADVINSFQFFKTFLFVIKIRIVLAEWVSSWGL
jgi:hypothetical protein